MSLPVGAGFLIAYYLLPTRSRSRPTRSARSGSRYWKVGPTELRILLAIGTLVLLRSPHAHVFGTPLLLFDIGGVAGIVGLLVTFLVSAVAKHAGAVSGRAAAGPQSPQRTAGRAPGTNNRSRSLLSGPREIGTLAALLQSTAWCSSPWTICSSAPRFARRRSRPAWSWLSPRSPGEILERARELKPPLAIFDLNSAKTDPIAHDYGDEGGCGACRIRAVGFVSHVRRCDDCRRTRGRYRLRHGALRIRGAARRDTARRRIRLVLITADDVRRRRGSDPRPRPADAAPILQLALGGRRRAGANQAGDAPADLLLQDPRRIQRRPAADRTPDPGRCRSSRHQRAITAARSLTPRGRAKSR